MTQKIGNCLGIRIGVQIVGRRLIITFSILRSGKLEKYKGGGCLKFKSGFMSNKFIETTPYFEMVTGQRPECK